MRRDLPLPRRSAAHPDPVVLVRGTFADMADNFNSISPLLYDHGYCVFALNDGGSPGSPIQSIGEILASAAQLAAFVGRVLAATGAVGLRRAGGRPGLPGRQQCHQHHCAEAVPAGPDRSHRHCLRPGRTDRHAERA
jgi:hypothetical protein